MECVQNMGWCKIAFTYSLRFLRENTNYNNALRQMILKAGDTDTNLAIVGGVIGAMQGFSNLDQEKINKVKNVEFKRFQRPDFLHPKNLETIVKQIFELSPSSLKYYISGKTYDHKDQILIITEPARASSTFLACLGSVFGCFLGDCLGASLQTKFQVTQQQIDGAMVMLNDGVYGTNPGQISDNCELLMALLIAFTQSPDILNLDIISSEMVDWTLMNPINIDNNNRSGLSALLQKISYINPTVSKIEPMDPWKAIQRAQSTELNKNSSLLIRTIAFAIWGLDQDVTSLKTAVRMYNQLTHNDQVANEACVLYLIALKQLFINQGDRNLAYQAAKLYAEQNSEKFPQFKKMFEEIEQGILPKAYPESQSCHIGISHAFYHLYQQTSILDAIKNTLTLGGETSINSAIVGGLLGAAEGFENLPQMQIQKIMSCKNEYGVTRIKKFHAKNAPSLIEKILLNKVSKLEAFIISGKTVSYSEV